MVKLMVKKYKSKKNNIKYLVERKWMGKIKILKRI